MKKSVGAMVSAAVLVGTTPSLSPEIFAVSTGPNVPQAGNNPRVFPPGSIRRQSSGR